MCRFALAKLDFVLYIHMYELIVEHRVIRVKDFIFVEFAFIVLLLVCTVELIVINGTN